MASGINQCKQVNLFDRKLSLVNNKNAPKSLKTDVKAVEPSKRRFVPIRRLGKGAFGCVMEVRDSTD